MSKDFDVNKIRQDFPILDRTIKVAKTTETTALGVAFIAGLKI